MIKQSKVYISSRDIKPLRIFMDENDIFYKDEGEYTFVTFSEHLPVLVEFAYRLGLKFYMESLPPKGERQKEGFYFECFSPSGVSSYTGMNGRIGDTSPPESFYLPDEVVEIAKRLFIKANKAILDRSPDYGTSFPFSLNYSFRNGEDYYYGFYLPFQFFEGVPVEEREKKVVEFLSDLTKDEQFAKYRLSKDDFTFMTGYIIISNPQSYGHILPNEIDEIGGIDNLSTPDRSVKMIVRRIPINDKSSAVVLSDDRNQVIRSSVAPISEHISDVFRKRFGKEFNRFRCLRIERVSPTEYWLTVTEFFTDKGNEPKSNQEEYKKDFKLSKKIKQVRPYE